MPDTAVIEKPIQKNRVEYADTMRGVCILLVNYFHSNISLFMIKYVADICVHPFLFMAGYFYSRRLSFRDNAIKKARSNLIPYYFFGLFYYLLWVVFFREQQRDILAPLKAVLFLPTGYFPIESALYFLPMMFFALIIFSIIEKCFKSEFVRLPLVVVITVLGNCWGMICDARLPMSIDVSMSLLIYVYLGYHGKTILAYLDSLLEKIKSSWLKLALFVLAALLNYLAVCLAPISNIRNGEWGTVPITHLNTCVTMVLWVYFFRWFDKVPVFDGISRVLKYIGKNSMIFMCFSHVGLKIGEAIAYRLPLPGFCCKLTHYILSIVVIFPVVYLFNKTSLHKIFGK